MTDVIKVLGDKIAKPFDIIGDQLDHWQKRKNAEQAHKHDLEQRQFEQEQAQKQKQFEQEQEQKRQQFNAEMDDLIARKEIERRALVAKSIAEYQKTMAECAVSIGDSLGKMRIELLAEATKFVNEQHKICKATQDDALNTAITKLKEIAELPDNQRAIIERGVDKFLNNAIDAADNFLKTVDSEFKRLNGDITVITGKTIEQAQGYISFQTARSLTGVNTDKIALSEPK